MGFASVTKGSLLRAKIGYKLNLEVISNSLIYKVTYNSHYVVLKELLYVVFNPDLTRDAVYPVMPGINSGRTAI